MSITRPRRLPSKFYLIAILALLFVLDGAILWFAARNDYKNTIERASITLEKAAISLEERARRTVASTEAILTARALRVQEKGMGAMLSSKEEWEHFRNAARQLPDAGSLWLLDSEANLLMDSTQYPSQKVNFSEREYFAPHRGQGVEFYIGPVVKGKVTKKYSFTISRRIAGKDGKFIGIVVAGMETDDFTNFLRNIELGEGGTVTIFRTDGAMILRQPMADELLGKTFRHLKLFSIPFEREPAGIFETGAIDGIRRLIAYRKVEGLPLLVATGIPVDSLLKEWTGRLKVYSFGAVVVFFVLLGLSWLVRRTTLSEENEKGRVLSEINQTLQNEIDERKKAEAALEAAYKVAENEKNRLRAVMDSLPVGVSVVDSRGGNVVANQAFERIWGPGRPRANSVGDYAAYSARWIDTGKQVLAEEWASARAVKNGETVVGQLMQIQRFDGTSAFIHNSAVPIRNATGEIVGSAVAVMDITDQQLVKEGLRRSIERLNIISDTASRLLFSADPREVIEDLCNRVMEHLDCQVFFNFLVDDEKDCLQLNSYRGIPEETAKTIRFLDYGVAICGCVARDACRIVAENIPATSDVRTDLVRSMGIKAYACHPLFALDKVIGTLSFGTGTRLTFTEDELSLMKIVADQVAIAMERTRLLRSEKERADEMERMVEKRTAQLSQQAELLNLAHDAVILTDMSGKIIFWSDGAKDTYGFSREDAVGNVAHELLRSRSQTPFSDIMAVMEREGRWEGELVHICKEGLEVTVHSRWALRHNEVDGTPEIMEVNRDITERKEAEGALKAERERLYTVLETLPAYVVLLTADYRIPFANRVFRDLFGDPMGKKCFEHLFARTEPCEICETYKVLKTVQSQRWQWTGPNGQTYDIHDFPFTDADGSALILEMGIDITDRKRAEDEIRYANAYNRSLIEASPDPLVTISAEGRITDINAATEKVTGYSRRELIGTDFSNYFTNPGKARDGYEQVFREGIVRDYELEIRHSAGYVTPVLYNGSVYKDESGRVIGVFAAARDISALRNAERALRESEERYRTAIENASDGIALVIEDRHAFVNRRFAEMFGYEDPAEIVGRPLSMTVHPDDCARVSEINRVRQGGAPAPSRYEFKGIKKDGSQRIIEVSAVRTTYLGEPASLAYLRDITDYKNLEDQLRHSQKMEAIGALAGGVAHDFNNILAAIIGFAEMVEEDIPLGKPKIEHIQRVIHAASRGRELVQQILTFSRKTERARHPVSLSAVARETAQLLRASIPTTVEIILDISAGSDTILATPVEIQQVLMNLSTNAALAMQEKGGILMMSIDDSSIEPESMSLEADMMPGEYVQLVVADTGAGMAPGVMERIFEPFFTTREVGGGTGMGLSVVYGIVKGLHGSISVESEPGVGSTFRVLFPKVRGETCAESFTDEQSTGDRERVLFIDDEKHLVEWGQALLDRLGYDVTAISDSMKALEVFTSDPSRFDVVITDQTMPGLTGLQLAGEFLKLRPDIPIILCTGYSDSITSEALEKAGIKELRMKPLGKQELAETIRRALGKEGNQPAIYGEL